METYGPELTIVSMEHMTISVMLASVEAPLLNARCSLMSKVVDATREFDGPLKTKNKQKNIWMFCINITSCWVATLRSPAV